MDAGHLTVFQDLGRKLLHTRHKLGYLDKRSAAFPQRIVTPAKHRRSHTASPPKDLEPHGLGQRLNPSRSNGLFRLQETQRYYGVNGRSLKANPMIDPVAAMVDAATKRLNGPTGLATALLVLSIVKSAVTAFLRTDASTLVSQVIFCPHYHQQHHSTDPRHFDKNFGLMLSVWDRMFGTLHAPEPNESFSFGLGSESKKHQSTFGLYVLPLQKIGQLLRLERAEALPHVAAPV